MTSLSSPNNDEHHLYYNLEATDIYTAETKTKRLEIDQGGETVNLWSLDNIAIPLTYVCVGFLSSFPSAYIQYYPRTLGASDAQLSTIGTVRSLPWSFKIAYGFLSDAFPLFGLRFKPYMILGYAISSFFNAMIAWKNQPSVVEFTMLLLGAMFGLLMTDVMADALVTCKSKKEPKAARGKLQSTVYLCRFFSEMTGFWIGSIICNKSQWRWGLSLSNTFMLVSFIPLVLAIPFILKMKEPVVDNVCSIKDQLRGLWKMVQLQAVWQPLSFIVLYNSLNTYNAAWGNYLQVSFGFSAFQYGSMSAVGSSVAFLGVYVYRIYFLNANKWRLIYYSTTLIITVFALLNIMLIFRVNEYLGIPPYWFAMGDTAIQYFAYGIQYLPSAIMWITVCPVGQEGVSFAMLTGFQNLSGGIATTISNLMLGIWPVQLEDLKRGEYTGVWKLTLLSNSINFIPLIFLPYLLPNGIDDIEMLKNNSSRNGGICVLVFFSFTVIWVVILNILAIISPCYAIVGGKGCT